MCCSSSFQAVPSSPPLLLLRRGQWGEEQIQARLGDLEQHLGVNMSADKDAKMSPGKDAKMSPGKESDMTPSQEMLVKAVQLGLADSTGQVGSVFMRIKM